MNQRISIVTTSYNQAAFLEEALASIRNQHYAPVEHIVIDGGSTDGSVDILRHHGESLAYWESTPDRGQVHALNKGLARATGEIFAFINSDDVLLPGALAAVGERLSCPSSSGWVCGDVLFFGEGYRTELVRTQEPRSAAHCLAWSYRAPQPGHFWRRNLIKGEFDERWSFAFDHEMYVRLLLAGRRCARVPVPVAAYRLHAGSKTVTESRRFGEEFDRIAELYEPRLSAGERRWCMATRLLRKSWSASEGGELAAGLRYLVQAVVTCPGALGHRPFWGCARRALLTAARRA
jgi:glycosyltransferase involved in cell wall biosynthesis